MQNQFVDFGKVSGKWQRIQYLSIAIYLSIGSVIGSQRDDYSVKVHTWRAFEIGKMLIACSVKIR